MKKVFGFTLVEMAVTILLIGLVMVMIARGFSVYEAAKVRKEINKIKTFESALMAYSDFSGGELPGVLGGDGRLDMSGVIQMGMIPASIFKSDMDGMNFNWVLIPCSRSGYPGDPINEYIIDGHLVSFNICALANSTDPLTSSLNYVMDSKLVCFLESVLDDKNTRKGLGLGLQYADTSGDYNKYDNCSTLKGYQSYAFLVY